MAVAPYLIGLVLGSGGEKSDESGGEDTDQNEEAPSDAEEVGKAITQSLREDLNFGLWMQDLNQQTKEMVEEMRESKTEIESLKSEIDTLEYRLAEMERTSEESQVEAMEEEVEEIEETRDRIHEKYRRKVRDALIEYKKSAEWLKNEFEKRLTRSNSDVPDTRNPKEVSNEFERIDKNRSEIPRSVSEVRVRENYDERADSIRSSRENFYEAVDSFMEERRSTVSTVESIQTKIPSMEASEIVYVPFWVVGLEKRDESGEKYEEIKVMPVQEYTERTESPSSREPYVDHLRSHQLHGYESMTDDVKALVAQEGVRENLATERKSFSGPQCIPSQYVDEKFVEEFMEHELNPRLTHDDRTQVETDTGGESHEG